MSKQIAFLEYSFVFDPSETWSNGYQFEKFLSDFCSSHGFEAQIIPTTGGTGRRVIYLTRGELKATPQPKVEPQVIRKPDTPPTKSFKQFQDRGVPKSLVNQEKRSPKVSFNRGRANRGKVRYG